MKKWLLAAVIAVLLAGCSGPETENELTQYEEYEILQEQLDLEELDVTVEADNSGNRVLIFSTESGEKKHKSIFVKDTEHLKIVNLGDDGLLYNDVIK